MNRLLLVVLTASVGFFAGCASFEHVPKDYTGPTAIIRDSGFSESTSKAQMFAVVEIDGNRVRNAFIASADASYGRGALLTTVFPERKVKAAPVKLVLRGSHSTAAPILAMSSKMAGTFFSVEGTVDFVPQPGVVYVVKGELKKESSSVWVEDVATGKRASSVVSK